jgi:hypothetical protein
MRNEDDGKIPIDLLREILTVIMIAILAFFLVTLLTTASTAIHLVDDVTREVSQQ